MDSQKWLEAHLATDGCILLLQERTQLLVQVAGLFWQLRMPQAHARARLINKVNGLQQRCTVSLPAGTIHDSMP